MFCASCGTQLTENARFCKACGAKVEVPVAFREEKKPFNIAMAVTLVLYTLCFFFVWERSEMVIATLGLIAVIVLWAIGVVKSDALGWEGLCLPVVAAGLTLARLVGLWALRRYAYFFLGGVGTAAAVAMGDVTPYAESVWGSDALWLWGMLIVVLLIRSGKLRHYPWVMLIALGVFLMWSLALTFLYPAARFAAQSGLPAEAMSYFLHCYRAYMSTMFLRRMVVCVFFCFFGAKRLGWVRMLLLPVTAALGALFLMAFGFVTLKMGMASVLGIAGGYLLASLILVSVLMEHLKERKLRSQYHIL